MSHSRLLAVALTASMLAGCTEPDGSPAKGVMQGGSPSKSDIGTAAGAIGGGIIGYQFGGGAGQALATVGGALLGGILGNTIGSSLDNADRSAYNSVSQHAMETGRAESWKNADSGNYGSIQPQKSYLNDAGQYCREYTQTIYVDGKRHTGHGVACRADDGVWRIIE